MSKHTPGPWFIKWFIKWEGNIFGPDDRLVANAGSHTNNMRSEEVRAENKANARLIAAAPDLLEAARAITGREWCTAKRFPELFAAIAKAEGGK